MELPSSEKPNQEQNTSLDDLSEKLIAGEKEFALELKNAVSPGENNQKEETPVEGLPQKIIAEEKAFAVELREASLRVEIDGLVDNLYEQFAYPDAPERLGDEIMKEWYWVEMEAQASKDKLAAKAKLEAFIRKLETL